MPMYLCLNSKLGVVLEIWILSRNLDIFKILNESILIPA